MTRMQLKLESIQKYLGRTVMVDNTRGAVPAASWNGAGMDDDESRGIEPNTDRRKLREVPSAPAPRSRPASEEEPRKRDWAAALALVQEAGEAIRFSEQRVEALERDLEMAAVQKRDEQRQLSGRLQSAQEEIQAANARAKAFEARALEAEAWLLRLQEAIISELGPYAGPEKR
jgi:hypothetical protein